MIPVLRSLPTRLALVVVTVATALVSGPLGEPAEAQTPPSATMELVGQPLFHQRDDGLGLRVKVVNRAEDPLEGFQIQTSIYTRIDSRTALHESFNGTTNSVVGGDVKVVTETLGPGDGIVVEVDPPITGVDLEGVYPVTLTLQDASTAQLHSLTTHLIYYPDPVEVPLSMALVVPIAPQPARGPTGAFETDNAGNYPLEDALREGGWVGGLLDGIQEGVRRGLSLGLAPSPRFVEELAGMSDGYIRRVGEETETVEAETSFAVAAARGYESLQRIMEVDGVQPLASPYAAPDLPTLYDTFGLERVSAQIDTGNTVLESLLPDVRFDRRWLFAPGSRWDEETLAQVRPVVGGDLRTFIGSTFLEDPVDETTPSCPASEDGAPGLFSCTVELEAERARVPAFVRDPDIQNRFAELAARGNDALDLQRLFAEIAFLHLERPGTGKRVVHATVPAHWAPRPRTAFRLFRGLARAPWLTTRTPEEAIDISVVREPVPIAEDLPELDEKPDDSYFQDITAAEELLATFNEMGPPAERSERLRRNLLVAESRSWWVNAAETRRGAEYAQLTEQEIQSEFGKITVSGPDTTLTSRRSAIEVNVFNDTTYPVTVDVGFETSEPGAIRIDDSDLDELQDIEVAPGEAPVINVDAIAESSGIYQVKASVLSPVSNEEISFRDIRIQSTNFNQIALGLTFGALAFLILFYVLRVVRRRRLRAEDTAEGAPS